MIIKVFKIIKSTKVEGPNLRYCIWVQGCSRHCKGCFATSTWDKSKGKAIDTKDIIKDVLKQKQLLNIEGVTFLGGEPFEQPKALAHIAKAAKKFGLSVVTFTGDTFENLNKSKNSAVKRLLNYTDLLIDGEFRQDKFDLSRPWVGSNNQRYIFLSDFYSPEDIKKYTNKIEVRVYNNGQISFNGMGDFSKIEKSLKSNFIKIK